MKPAAILGISAYYHDSAAALVIDGRIAAAAQEERFSRVKGDASFPWRAVAGCLRQEGLDIQDVDHVVYYENSLRKFERLITSYHLTAPRSLRNYLRAMPDWIVRKLWAVPGIRAELGLAKTTAIHSCEHHLSHAASAFYPSPFEESAILTIDGVGEWTTASYGVGDGNCIRLLKRLSFPNSLGLLYSAFTSHAGFKINSGEYKLMGLAPYGRPVYADLIRTRLARVAESGAITLNQRYFNYVGGLTMINGHFTSLFGPPRKPESEITQREMDLAASIQTVVEEVVLKMATHVRRQTGMKNLALAGGVALNVVAMGKLAREKVFERIWIQPAAGDAGGALGAALWFHHTVLDRPRTAVGDDSMQGSFLGPEIADDDEEDDQTLTNLGAAWESLPVAPLQERIARLAACGKVVAVARGRMEWGPRALGARSILGDPRQPEMQSHMNLKIKFRESFRPFAPMVLQEDAHEYFDMTDPSPYMLMAFPVAASRRKVSSAEQTQLWGLERLKVVRSDIPAVTHVDFSARVQTVNACQNPFMHGVLTEFKKATGCSVLINTSFNVRGEPIVSSVEDAFRCFAATEIDAVVIGNRLMLREQQACLQGEAARRWRRTHESD